MEKYEVTYLSPPDDKTNTVEGAVKALGGFIADIKDLGTKELAYPINKLTRCRYTSVIFTLDSENLAQLEGGIAKDESIVRYILIKALRANKPSKPRDPSKAKTKIKPKAEKAEGEIKPVAKPEPVKPVKKEIKKATPVKEKIAKKPTPKKPAKPAKKEKAPSVEELDKKLKELVKD